MTTINHITYKEILRISPQQFAELLLRLLRVEAYSHSIPLSRISVPLNITVADGGEDGSIKWDDGRNGVGWLLSNDICFQVKATEMSPSDCKNEIIINAGTKKKPDFKLKSEVKSCFERSGMYLLFVRQSLTASKITARINAFRKAVEEAGESYHKACKIEIYDANKIANWVNEYPSIVAYVCEVLGLAKNNRFRTFGHWKGKEEDFTKFDFVENDFTKQCEEQFQKVVSETGNILRITGLSGLGKTRLIYQFFNSENDDSEFLRSSVLYYDASNNFGGLVDEIAELSLNKGRCNLIIDNCSLEIHNKLKKELKGTSFNLFTTDSDPSSYNSHADDENHILIEPSHYEDLIPIMLAQLFPEIGESDIRRIQEFSQGFPLIAVILAKQYQRGSGNMGELSETEIVNKLLGIESGNEDSRIILRTVSLFDFIGFYEDFESQRNFLATYQLITPLNVASEEIAKRRFYEVCEKYRERGLIEKKGRQISLRPKPLALRLAREWWENLPESSLNEILEKLTENNLATQLCDQVAKLDFVPKAKELTVKLCGHNGPFGHAEVLNTKQGSRLFRSLVEVNPEATVSCMVRVFSIMPIDEIEKIDDGRRNLVWALEKLCFRKETFERAANIMMLFSLAENETWGNNSTNQFLHLFHVYLAGTEANLNQRLNVILETLSAKNPRIIRKGLSAIKSAFKAHGFSRMGGAEKQGSGPSMQDYIPSNTEIINYWSRLIEEVRAFLVQPEFSDQAKEVLVSASFNFAIAGTMKIVLPVIEELAEREGELSEKLVDTLKSSLRHERKFLTKAEREKIEELLRKYEPQDTLSLYRKYVARPNWDDFRGTGVGVSEQARERAEKFAPEFKEKVDPKKLFEILYDKEQQEGYYFGRALTKLYQDEEAWEFICGSVDYLSKNLDNLNPIVLNGFLAASSQDFLSRTLTHIEENHDYVPLLFIVMRSVPLGSKRMMRLFDIIDQDDRFDIRELLNLRYSYSLEQLDISEVLQLAQKLSTYQHEGNWIGLLLLDSYCYNNDERWLKCQSEVKKMLKTKGLLNLHRNVNSMEIYSWETLVLRIMSEGNVEFIEHVANEIVDICNTPHFDYGLDSYLRKVLQFLFEKHFDTAWKVFSRVFLLEGEQFIMYFNFKHLIDSQFGFGEGLLFKNTDNQTKIFEWTKTVDLEGVRRIAQIMPVLDTQDYSWHPFAMNIIDEHGGDREVLSSISSNLGTYSWSGSSVPLYEGKMRAFQVLLDHRTPLVREWASSQIEYCQDRIKSERNRDEERYL